MNGNITQSVAKQATTNLPEIIAVHYVEVGLYGCPHCGYRSGSTPMSGNGGSIWQCGDCERSSVLLADGVKISPFEFGSHYPKLQAHPRRGIPSHGTPDKRPEDGSEFFHSRGIGLDYTPGCFVHAGKDGMYNNIAAFVQCREAGNRVVKMFGHGARLDYRTSEPDRVQAKIGACKLHLKNLERLEYFCSDGTINADKVVRAKALTPKFTASTKLSATRIGKVDTLAAILKQNLREWAHATASQAVKNRDEVQTYPISILLTDGGYTRQLIYGGETLICELHERRNSLTVELYLPKSMPVGPWDASRVTQLFKDAHSKEVTVPEGVSIPKIVRATIEPVEHTWNKEKGFDLDIVFKDAPFGAPTYEQQTSLINRAVNTGLDSWDCCHFFSNKVGMFFPTKETAEAALARVRKICPEA